METPRLGGVKDLPELTQQIEIQAIRPLVQWCIRAFLSLALQTLGAG